MTKIFTPNDVILYVYGEIKSPTEKIEIENALVMNSELADFFYEITSMKSSISKIVKEPSVKVIDKILNYSKSYNLQAV
ncbi:MAG TPA: hypothetical protein VF691_14075 [Cytophagaceae bacterium]|jgi:hypothetical protein